MSPITDVMTAHGHEQVVFVADAATGLRAVIAVHSTALGPALGGVRFWPYASEAEAVTDVLLDWALSDMPGSEVCRQLKGHDRTRPLPLVVVTSVSSEIDRIVAFELGVVDYITEPFSVRELLLRLRVALESKGSAAKAAAPRSDALLALDFEARRALVRDHEIALSPREFDLLAVLQGRPGMVLSRTQLRQAVWGEDPVSLRTIDASVKRLRRKLGPARHCVETVRGVGYRFREGDDRKSPSKVA